ncbi:MAG: hypothetical protein DCF20_18480 [Pseudanabaena sp.]|nr:MAG: hypothetical protein DCF20_18480 [Pseudanabaena sp.]
MKIFFAPIQFYTHSKKVIETINWIIEEDQIDIVQMHFFENLNLVASIPLSIKKIFVCHESRFARIQTHIETKKIGSSFTDYVLDFNKIIELSFLKMFDAIISFTEYDKLEINEAIGEEKNKPKLATIPFAILDQEFSQLDINHISPIEKLVFIGGDEHYPNQDAIEWFIDEVAEEIRLRYGLRLCVVGNWSKKLFQNFKIIPVMSTLQVMLMICPRFLGIALA